MPQDPARSWVATGLLLTAASLISCSDADLNESVLVFSGEGNRLNAYAPDAGDLKQTVIERNSIDPDGWDINAQICFDPRAPAGSNRFIAGEDTDQPDPPAGWGYFELHGREIGELSATRIGKLTPTYQPAGSSPENYGCGFLSNGTLVTTDVGNQASGDGTGQLMLWFPPFDSTDVSYCKLDIEIGTAGGIYVGPGDEIYVASARVAPGIWRYTPPYPTSNDAAGGCGREDSTGAPVADSITKGLFIPSSAETPTTSAVWSNGRGGYYVTSVLNGVIAEFDQDGQFLRRILEPPTGEGLGPVPYSTGSPFGIGVDSGGNIYYADIGLVLRDNGSIGPGSQVGTVRRIQFRGDEPQAPETLDSGLSFPDGIGILESRGEAGG
ncbi:MAG: hypothetical protein P8R42_11835 [Candidatus Binatia bacterium]|nr:hypothetical protein [Candidatus Binatia bacterium]